MKLEPLWATGGQLSPALRYTLTGHIDGVSAVACTTTSDGRIIAVTTGGDLAVRVWDALAGQPIGTPLTGHTRMISAVACITTDDGRVIAITASHDDTVRIWDVRPDNPSAHP